MYLIFLLYALFASVFTAAKVALQHAEPFFIVGSRMVIAGVLLSLYLLVFKKEVFASLERSHLKRLLLLSVFNIYLTNGLELWGMKYLTSSKACFIYSLSPFFAAFLSFIFLREKLSPKKWLGLSIGFLGFLPILWQPSGLEGEVAAWGIISLAEGAMILAALSTVYGWFLMRQLVTDGICPILANAVSMLWGGIFSLIHSFLAEPWTPFPVSGFWLPVWESILWTVIISSMIGYNLYGYLLKHYSLTFLSFAGFTTPFFVAVFSWLVIQETVSWGFLVSAFIVFWGLFIFYLEELKKDGIKK